MGRRLRLASASITPRALTSTASIGGTLSKVYDGTTQATGATLSGNVLGAITNDVLILDTSGLTLAYNSARVLGASHIAASGSTAFSIATSTSGSVLSDYSFSGPTITPASASITPRALTSTAGIGGTLSKVYDGATTATGATLSGNVLGAITNDVLLLDTSGLSLAYNSARVLGASQIAASGSTAFNIASSASGSVLSDYSFSGPTITPASASITPRALTSTASIGGALSKVYDGTTQATGATVSGNVLGAITNDVLNLDTSGLSLAYNSARVLGASQITVSGSTAFKIATSASGSALSDYSFSGPTIVAASASITPRALTSTASIGGTLSKVYDGTTQATGATLSGNVLGAISNDALNLDTSSINLAYNSARVLFANQIAASGSTAFNITSSASGSLLSDYSFSGPTIASASASITPRAHQRGCQFSEQSVRRRPPLWRQRCLIQRLCAYRRTQAY